MLAVKFDVSHFSTYCQESLQARQFRVPRVFIAQIQLANSSRAINWGAIFSAVSWSKSLPITVLGSCNILECDSKVFFRQNLLFCYCFCYCFNSMGFVDCICSNRQKMDFSAMHFIISVALHVCPLICATKEKQTMMVTVLHQIRKSNINLFLKTMNSTS